MSSAIPWIKYSLVHTSRESSEATLIGIRYQTRSRGSQPWYQVRVPPTPTPRVPGGSLFSLVQARHVRYRDPLLASIIGCGRPQCPHMQPTLEVNLPTAACFVNKATPRANSSSGIPCREIAATPTKRFRGTRLHYRVPASHQPRTGLMTDKPPQFDDAHPMPVISTPLDVLVCLHFIFIHEIPPPSCELAHLLPRSLDFPLVLQAQIAELLVQGGTRSSTIF